jgi:hypothetical protein
MHEHTNGHDHEHEGGDAMDDCIEACLQCHVVTTMTAQYCLAKGGDLSDVSMVGVLLDCAEISQTSANFMLRGSPFHTLTCGACAEICRTTAEACRQMASNDEHLTHCAEVCEHCAEHCAMMEQEGDEEDE